MLALHVTVIEGKHTGLVFEHEGCVLLRWSSSVCHCYEPRWMGSALHASLLTELTKASVVFVCFCEKEREKGSLCSHIQKQFSAGWNSGYSVCLFFCL